MKPFFYSIALSLLAALNAAPNAAYADEFGARFYGQAPSALGGAGPEIDGLGSPAKTLAKAKDPRQIRPELIEPAAGEYFDSQTQKRNTPKRKKQPTAADKTAQP